MCAPFHVGSELFTKLQYHCRVTPSSEPIARARARSPTVEPHDAEKRAERNTEATETAKVSRASIASKCASNSSRAQRDETRVSSIVSSNAASNAVLAANDAESSTSRYRNDTRNCGSIFIIITMTRISELDAATSGEESR